MTDTLLLLYSTSDFYKKLRCEKFIKIHPKVILTPDYKLLFTIQMRKCNLFLPGINPEWVCWVEKCERERWTDRERWREEKRDNGKLVSMCVCVQAHVSVWCMCEQVSV